MSFRRRAGGGKRDAAEAAIVDALRGVGASVYHLSGVSNPDLLAWFRGRPYVMEVKSGKGTVTKNQVAIPWPIVRTPEQALAVIGVRGDWGGLGV